MTSQACPMTRHPCPRHKQAKGQGTQASALKCYGYYHAKWVRITSFGHANTSPTSQNNLMGHNICFLIFSFFHYFSRAQVSSPKPIRPQNGMAWPMLRSYNSIQVPRMLHTKFQHLGPTDYFLRFF